MTTIEKIQVFDDKSVFLLFDLAAKVSIEGPQADGTFTKVQALAYAKANHFLDLAVTGFWGAECTA